MREAGVQACLYVSARARVLRSKLTTLPELPVAVDTAYRAPNVPPACDQAVPDLRWFHVTAASSYDSLTK